MDKQFVIRRDGVAMKFITNACGKHMRGVVDSDATKFDAQWIAENKAATFGLPAGTFTIEELNTQPVGK